MSTGLLLHGCCAAQTLDSTAEILNIESADVSSLDTDDGIPINYEHQSGAEEGSGNDIVGKVLTIKKIYKASDCENDFQKKTWTKLQVPFMYFTGRLFDGAGHEGAKALAAIIRDCKANNEPIIIRWSVEGSTLRREGPVLKETIIRAIAATRKPANKAASTDILYDPKAPEGFEKNPNKEEQSTLDALMTQKTEHPLYRRLGAPVEVEELVDEVECQALEARLREALVAKLAKATIAGTTSSSLSGGACLQREDAGLREKHLTDLGFGKYLRGKIIKAIANYGAKMAEDEDFDEDKFKKFMKDQIPEASDEFIQHFVNAAKDFQVKSKAVLNKALGKPFQSELFIPPVKVKSTDDEDDSMVVVGDEPLTVKGVKVVPTPETKKAFFNESTGVLHTSKGGFSMYLPKDKELETFHHLINDPKVNAFHSYAMDNWSRVNQLLKQGKLPPEVVMHATLFSELSPNTKVSVQELMFSKLHDLMIQHGIDARDPRFEHLKADFLASDKPNELPVHSRAYFEGLGPDIRIGQPTGMKDLFTGKETWEGSVSSTGRAPGELIGFSIGSDKFDRMAKYHTLHHSLVDLVNRHKDNTRAAVQELLYHKGQAEAHLDRRVREIAAGREDPGAYTAGPSVPGLAPKTARYAWGMMGGATSMVPDTHFVRYLFGLDKARDARSIKYLKNILWDTNSAEVLNGIDRYYAENHPAVQHMMEHPQFKHLFPTREHAIFPAFWKNWIIISPHEKSRGYSIGKSVGVSGNVSTTHKPFWEAIDPYVSSALEKNEEGIALPARTAQMHAQWVRDYGEVPALHLYYRYLVPSLLNEAERRERNGQTFKAEELGIDLTKDEKGNPVYVAQPLPTAKVQGKFEKRTGPQLQEDGTLVIPKGGKFPRGVELPVVIPHPEDPAYMGVLHPLPENHVAEDEVGYINRTVHEPFKRAMSQWLPLNSALAKGQMPLSIVKFAGLFAAMSPATTTHAQERHFGHTMDMINEGVLDFSKPIDSSHVTEFISRTTGESLPKWNREYYESIESGRQRKVGQVEESRMPQTVGLAYLDEITGWFADQIDKYRDDGRTISKNLMDAKAAYIKRHDVHALAVRTARKKGLEPPQAEEKGDVTSLIGYGPKLSRYSMALMGAGNMIVPDRHMIASLYDLDADDEITKHLLDTIRKPRNEYMSQILDKKFLEHPAVKHVLEMYPDHFRGREEQAIYPANWLHWLAIPHYNRRIDRAVTGNNLGTDHAVYWDAIRGIARKNGIPVPDWDDTSFNFGENVNKTEHPMSPLERAVGMVEEVRLKHGEIPAQLAYFTYVVPLLTVQAPQGNSLQKAEALLINLRKMAGDIKKAREAVVVFNGTQVVPGKISFPHAGKDYDTLAETEKGYIAVPSAIGASNWEKKHLLHISKNREGIKVITPPRPIVKNNIIDATVHGLPVFNRTPEQNALIHGIDTKGWTDVNLPEINKGIWGTCSGEGTWARVGGGKLAFVKSSGRSPKEVCLPSDRDKNRGDWDTVHSEACFHNVVRDVFGLGQHTPTTSLFKHPINGLTYSVHEGVMNGEHYDMSHEHNNALLQLAKEGTLGKLRVMDEVMGIPDRHDGNWLLTFDKGKPNIHLIDNEYAFMGRGDTLPSYWSAHRDLLGSWDKAVPQDLEIDKWTMKLDPMKLEMELRRHGVPDKDVSRSVNVLRGIQRKSAIRLDQAKGVK